MQRAAIEQYNMALAVANTIPPSPFSMKILDPGNNRDAKRQFYKKSHSSVVTDAIQASPVVIGYNNLLIQQETIAFYNDAIDKMEFDGATMIYLIFMKMDHSTVVGLDSVLNKLETTKLGDHSNCVDPMLTIMEGN